MHRSDLGDSLRGKHQNILYMDVLKLRSHGNEGAATRRMTFMDELIPRLHGRKGAVKGDCMDALMSELQEPFPTVHPVHPVHKKPGNARFIQIASIAILIYDPSEVVFSASTSLAGLSISSTIAMGALSPVL